MILARFLWPFVIGLVPYSAYSAVNMFYSFSFETGEMVAGEMVSFTSEWQTLYTGPIYLTSYRFYVAKSATPTVWITSFEGNGEMDLSLNSASKGRWNLDEVFDLTSLKAGDTYDIHFEFNGYYKRGILRTTISLNWNQTKQRIGIPYGKVRYPSNHAIYFDSRHHWYVSDHFEVTTSKLGNYVKQFHIEPPSEKQRLPAFTVYFQLYENVDGEKKYVTPPPIGGDYLIRDRRANYSAGTRVGTKDVSFPLLCKPDSYDGHAAKRFALRNNVYMDRATGHIYQYPKMARFPSRLIEVDFLTMPVGEAGAEGVYRTELEFDYDQDTYRISWQTQNDGIPPAGNDQSPYVVVLGE